MVLQFDPRKWFGKRPAEHAKPLLIDSDLVRPLPASVTGVHEDVTAQAVENGMETIAPVTQPQAAVVEQPKKNEFVGFLKKAGTVFGKVLGIAGTVAVAVEPEVDAALIASGKANASALYDKVAALSIAAQATWGADPKHNDAKAADVLSKLEPQIDALFGSDAARAKTYVDSVVMGLGVLDAVGLAAPAK